MQEVEAARNALSVVTPTAILQARFAPVLSNQVRVSSGATHAPGCIDPESGRMMWSAMVLRMNAGGCPRLRTERASVPVKTPPLPEDYAVPEALANTNAGRLYAILLAEADTEGSVMPSNLDIEIRTGIRSNGARALLVELQDSGWIVRSEGGGQREVLIVATGQVLRSVRGHSAAARPSAA